METEGGKVEIRISKFEFPPTFPFLHRPPLSSTIWEGIETDSSYVQRGTRKRSASQQNISANTVPSLNREYSWISDLRRCRVN